MSEDKIHNFMTCFRLVESYKWTEANNRVKVRSCEGELKMLQEGVNELERSKKEVEAAIMRKDNESCNMEEVVRKVLETVKFDTIY